MDLVSRCRYEKVPISVQEADDEFQEHETAPVSFNPTQDEIRDSQQYESAASSAISSESLQEEGDNFQEDSSCGKLHSQILQCHANCTAMVQRQHGYYHGQ